MRRPLTEPGEEERLRFEVKAEIRRRRRSVRRAMPMEARHARSAAIGQRVLELDEWGAAEVVLAYASMPAEVQTQAVVEAAWAAGKRVAAPRLGETPGTLELRAWSKGDSLEESGMGFVQPAEGSELIADSAIDLVLVPALAVDERGHRVGYGKGYYDGLLPRVARATRVALVFDFERVAEVPERPEDERVDAIVTDARVLRCAPLRDRDQVDDPSPASD